MMDLINSFTPVQILTFSILGVCGVKGLWDMIDFFKNKYKEKFNTDVQKLNKEKELSEFFEDYKAQQEELKQQHEEVNNKLDILTDSIVNLTQRVDRLTTSDKNDIKQYIVKEYHHFVEEQHWIDDYSLDAILQRFEDYKLEGGNSYVHTLVEEIKKLPKHPV